MYLNLIQIAESFGVSEKVVNDWIRNEGLPCTPDRNRLLFDRSLVAEWAAARGLGAKAGFLAPDHATRAGGFRMDELLRTGGIWRGVRSPEVTGIFEQVVRTLPDVPKPVLDLITQRLRVPGGVVYAPVGGGFALPHPSSRISLGKNHGTMALLLMDEPFDSLEPTPDQRPIHRMFFFIAPSPRAHLDLLGRISRMLSRGPLRKCILDAAPDDQILEAMKADSLSDGIND
jgi:PTS system nitrogen regulatory IIA component